MCSARNCSRDRGACARAARSTVESKPPLYATQIATLGDAGRSCASCARSHREPKPAAFTGRSRGRFGIHTECGNLGAARFPQLLAAHLLEGRQMTHEGLLQTLRHLRWIAMGPTERLLENLIDETELRQAVRGEAHGVRRRLFLLGALPQN